MKYLIMAALFMSSPAFADMQQDIVDIQHAWAKANYDTTEDQQEKAFEELVKQAQAALPAA